MSKSNEKNIDWKKKKNRMWNHLCYVNPINSLNFYFCCFSWSWTKIKIWKKGKYTKDYINLKIIWNDIKNTNVQLTQVLHSLTKHSLLMLSLASCARMLIRMMALVLITRSLSVAKVSSTKSCVFFAKNSNFHI